MAGKLKILFVEDVLSDAELMIHEIEKNKISFSKQITDNKEDYIEYLKDFQPDLIISDYSLPRFDGMAALLLRNEQSPLISFILVTGSVNEEVAVECMKAGADDYILKENLSRLGQSIINALKKAKLAKEKKSAEEELKKSELRLQKAQAIAHVGNWELDLSTKKMWSSKEAMKIYGLYDESQKFTLDRVQEIPLPEYRAILDISNIEANLIKTVRNEINLNRTLKSLCNQFIPKTDEKKINLVCETGLADSDALILSDSTKLTQILSNLISNALKFTEKGYIKLKYKLKDNFLEFSISDTGIGILPVYHERIFDRFYQVQSSVSMVYEGTGLGLAISKAYVELLGGKIWLSSEPGKGTTFFFTIPYKKGATENIPDYEKKAIDSFVFPVKKVILVAEDIESNFKLIRYFLEGSNAEVLHAYNGREAVEKCFAEGNIDLILMDIKMPVMDGYTAVQLIREKNTKIPIIAQTAYADDRDKAIECGCSGFISKPFDKKSLFKVLSEFI